MSEVDGRAAGFANFGPSRDEPGCGELYMIYVAPESWSRGCGQALIGEVQHVLGDHGFTQAIL